MAEFTVDQLKYFAKRHIKYEIEATAYIAATWWTSGMALRPRLCVALLEAGLIHVRLLDAFLWPDLKSKRPDDVWAGDYLPQWQPSAEAPLKAQRRIVSKQLAHLSMMRQPEQPTWDLRQLTLGTFEAFEAFLALVDEQAPDYSGSFSEAREVVSRFLGWMYDFEDGMFEGGPYAPSGSTLVASTTDLVDREPLWFPPTPTYHS